MTRPLADAHRVNCVFSFKRPTPKVVNYCVCVCRYLSRTRGNDTSATGTLKSLNTASAVLFKHATSEAVPNDIPLGPLQDKSTTECAPVRYLAHKHASRDRTKAKSDMALLPHSHAVATVANINTARARPHRECSLPSCHSSTSAPIRHANIPAPPLVGGPHTYIHFDTHTRSAAIQSPLSDKNLSA